MAICKKFLGALWLAALAAAMTATANAGDVVEGEALFNRECSYCHSFSPFLSSYWARVPRPMDPLPSGEPEPFGMDLILRGQDKRGPHLYKLMQRPPGAARYFPYRFVYEIEGDTWTEADLDAYLLVHAGLGEAERANLIAFLKAMTGP